nr:MAG TPA: hypothetical protein [Caudoviricetes sp.]
MIQCIYFLPISSELFRCSCYCIPYPLPCELRESNNTIKHSTYNIFPNLPSLSSESRSLNFLFYCLTILNKSKPFTNIKVAKFSIKISFYSFCLSWILSKKSIEKLFIII